MLRKIALSVAYLAAQRLAPGSSFTPPLLHPRQTCHHHVGSSQYCPFSLLARRPKAVSREIPSRIAVACPRQGEDGFTGEDRHAVESDASVDGTVVKAIMQAGIDCQEFNGQQLPQRMENNKKPASPSALIGALLACSMIASSCILLAVPPSFALGSTTAARQEQQVPLLGLVKPRHAPRVRPPPPAIPPGRITIAQWCDRNIGKYVPKLNELQTAGGLTIEHIKSLQINSGPPSTVEDLMRMGGAAVERGWSDLRAESSTRGGSKKNPDLAAGPASSPAVVADEALTDTLGTPAPKFTRQEQIDALKVEMLSLQDASPEPNPVPNKAGSSGRYTPGGSSSSRVIAVIPSAFKIRMPSPTKAEPVVAVRSSRNKPAVLHKDKKRPARDTVSIAVDLKAELRVQSEKAAAIAFQRPKKSSVPRESSSPRTPEAQATSTKPVELLVPAIPTSTNPPSLETTPAVKAPVRASSRLTPSAGEDEEMSASSKISTGLEAVAGAARISLEKLDLGGRLSDTTQDVVEQVKYLTKNRQSASEAGVASVLEQGRANVDRLQTEVGRMSAGLSETKTPLVGKLFSSITNLPKSAGSDLSKLSGRVTAKLSGSAKGVATSVVGVTDAATGIVGVGTATAGRLTEALGRGADNVLPLVGEAGRVVNDGVSALSTGAFDGLPGFQVKVSVFSSQMADASGRIAFKATDSISNGMGQLLGRFSGLAGRRPELLAWVKGALGHLPSLGGAFANGATTFVQKCVAAIRGVFGSSFSDEEADGVVYVAAATVATLGAVAVLRGLGAGSGTEAGATGVASGGKLGVEKGGARGEALQTIGVNKEIAAAAAAASEDLSRGQVSAEAVSATGALWDIIRQSGTGAGDAVREVSEEDLVARAVQLGQDLRETTQGIEFLKHEVVVLRESLRESDLEGKAEALRERLASALEGSIFD